MNKNSPLISISFLTSFTGGVLYESSTMEIPLIMNKFPNIKLTSSVTNNFKNYPN